MNIDYHDEKVWDLICTGYSKGIFQCESRLVQEWLRKAQPRNVWELSAVIALVRPGALKSGYADQYVEYKHGNKEFESFGHSTIDEVFSVNHNCLVYQENLMSLGMRLAWPHLPEQEKLVKVDKLRKAVGKKKQDQILAIGQEFVEGCLHNEVDKEVAEKLFEVIKNCGRYLFNLSHSMAYARLAYKTAYMKFHYPLQFYAVYLSYAKEKLDKWEEIAFLVRDAKTFGIDILPPNINVHNNNFSIEDDAVRYGLGHIKHVGTSYIKKIHSLPKIDNWKKFLKLTLTDEYGFKIKSNTTEALITTGCFADTGESRSTLLNVYKIMSVLTERERAFIFDKIDEAESLDDLSGLINQCSEEICNKRRRPIVQSELAFLKVNIADDPSWIEQQEIANLGIGVSATALDAKDNIAPDKCGECFDTCPTWTEKHVHGIIDKVFTMKTKKGKNPGQSMAQISFHDESGSLERIAVFPELYAKVGHFLIERNAIKVHLKMGKGGWFINDLEQL